MAGRRFRRAPVLHVLAGQQGSEGRGYDPDGFTEPVARMEYSLAFVACAPEARGQGGARNLERRVVHIRFCHVEAVHDREDIFPLHRSCPLLGVPG